jgi:hypothetical protein
MERTKKVGVVKYPYGFKADFTLGQSDEKIKESLSNLINPFSRCIALGEPEISITEEPFTQEDWIDYYRNAVGSLSRENARSMIKDIKKELDTMMIVNKEDLKDKILSKLGAEFKDKNQYFIEFSMYVDLLFDNDSFAFITGTDKYKDLFEYAVRYPGLSDSIASVISSRNDRLWLINNQHAAEFDHSDRVTVLPYLFAFSSDEDFKKEKEQVISNYEAALNRRDEGDEEMRPEGTDWAPAGVAMDPARAETHTFTR